MTIEQRYEEVPYPGRPLVQAHPDRLATLARLHGMPAPQPDGSRVLEVGCGDGANLIPMACTLGAATFVGIDTSASAIAAARATAGELGLENIVFE
ncbi:MAG: methyltransferase domain-containing protein, partial [Solirubrobacteraceae bacterium]